MKKNIVKILLSVFTIILILFASYASYYNTINAVKRAKIKEVQEVQYESANCFSIMNALSSDIDNTAYAQESTRMDLVEIISSRALSIILILAIILSLFQFYLYIRNWMITISQSNNNLLLVHYFHVKDGKKDALSRV